MHIFGVISLIIVASVQIIAWRFSHLVVIWGSEELRCQEHCKALGLWSGVVLGNYEWCCMFSHILMKNKLTLHAVGEGRKEVTHISAQPLRLFQMLFILSKKGKKSLLIVNTFMFKPTILKCLLKPVIHFSHCWKGEKRLKIKAIYEILIHLLNPNLTHILLYLI